MTATYASTLELARFMHIESTLPSREAIGVARTPENVGTGDNSTTGFYLDNAYVLASSYTIYYGADVDNLTALTETTHYTLDKDLGKITLTAAGVTAVGTNKIYADYSYVNAKITDTELQAMLDAAQAQVDKETYNHWADGSVATPDYNQYSNEKHKGKGRFDRSYFLRHFPLPDVSTTLDGTVAADDTTITVDSTAGFPSSGSIVIGSDRIDYTGKTSTTFTGCTSVEAHSDGDSVSPHVIEISTTEEGSTPTWTVLQHERDVELNLVTGSAYVQRDRLTNFTTADAENPPRLIPNRFRASYLSGNNTIPDDIKRLTLMIAAKDNLHTVVRHAISAGRDNFDETNVNIDTNWIQQKIESYRQNPTSNI